MHVVGVHDGEFPVGGAYHAEHLWPVRVLDDFDDVALVGHLVPAIHAEGLCLELVGAVGGEFHFLSHLAAIGHGRVVISHKFGNGGPLVDERPRIGAFAAIAQAQALKALVLTVQARHAGGDATSLVNVGLVDHRVVDGEGYGRRRGHEMYTKIYGVTLYRGVFLGLQQKHDVVIVDDAAVALHDDEGFLKRLASLHLDGTPFLAVAHRGAVYGKHGTVGIAALLHLQHVVADVVGLALVGQLQPELSGIPRGDVGELATAEHLQLRILHLHRGFVELGAFLVEQCVACAFVGIGSLSATCAEDGSPSGRRIIDIHGEGRPHVAVAHGPCYRSRLCAEGVFAFSVAPRADALEDDVGTGIVNQRTELHILIPRERVGAGVRVARLAGTLGGHAHLCAAGDGVVLDEAFAILEGLELVSLVVGYAFAPYLDLVDGIFYLVVLVLCLGAVHHAIAWETVGACQLLVGPEVDVTIGTSELCVAWRVLGVVDDLAGNLRRVARIPVVAADVPLLKFAADDGLPVGNERIEDVGLRIGELGAEAFADSDAGFLGERKRVVVLLEEPQDATLAEE